MTSSRAWNGDVEGRARGLLDRAVEEVPLMDGCRELLALLAARRIRTAIVSNGLERLGLRLAREFGIARVAANREGSATAG